jgi:hypothetical protein
MPYVKDNHKIEECHMSKAKPFITFKNQVDDAAVVPASIDDPHHQLTVTFHLRGKSISIGQSGYGDYLEVWISESDKKSQYKMLIAGHSRQDDGTDCFVINATKM